MGSAPLSHLIRSREIEGIRFGTVVQKSHVTFPFPLLPTLVTDNLPQGPKMATALDRFSGMGSSAGGRQDGGSL